MTVSTNKETVTAITTFNFKDDDGNFLIVKKSEKVSASKEKIDVLKKSGKVK